MNCARSFASERLMIALLMCGILPAIAYSTHADVPQTAAELWADFPTMDKATPLEAEVHKTWEQDGVVVELVRFTVAVIDGQKLKLAGFFAYPKEAKNLPGLVQCHGGGQRASVGGPVSWARNGYATFCPNNGAQPWGEEGRGLPNTDWGRFNPAVRKPDKRSGEGRLSPGEGTVDQVVSPRNEAMYLRMRGIPEAKDAAKAESIAYGAEMDRYIENLKTLWKRRNT